MFYAFFSFPTKCNKREFQWSTHVKKTETTFILQDPNKIKLKCEKNPDGFFSMLTQNALQWEHTQQATSGFTEKSFFYFYLFKDSH